MANNQINKLLEFINMQIGAESFLLRDGDGGAIPGADVIKARLELGNARTKQLTPLQAQEFTDRFEVLTQYRNDPLLDQENGIKKSGFSATLFKNKETGELTLSIRSTELEDDYVRDNIANNFLELRDKGWMLGQLAELENWYKTTLIANSEFLNAGESGIRRFSVTGFSLGGHLAAAFALLRREEYGSESSAAGNPLVHTYTLNAPGTGRITDGSTLTSLLNEFNTIRADYVNSSAWKALTLEEQGVVRAQADAALSEIQSQSTYWRSLTGVASSLFPNSPPPLGVQNNLGYQIAAAIVNRRTQGAFSVSTLLPGGPLGVQSVHLKAPVQQRFDNLTDVFGLETNGEPTSFVSNTGLHYSAQPRIAVPIEAQPFFRGNVVQSLLTTFLNSGKFQVLFNDTKDNDFGDTHSLILLQTSLSLMAAMEKLAPALTMEAAGQIFAAMTNTAMLTKFGEQGKAEGDNLERALEALRKLVVPADTPNRAPSFAEEQLKSLLVGNTFHQPGLREVFQKQVSELRNRVTALAGGPNVDTGLSLTSLTTIHQTVIRDGALAEDATGAAYRYAVRELNPFVIIGGNANAWFYDSINTSGELNLYKADPRTGTLTSSYLDYRAQLLARFMYYNLLNARYDVTQGTSPPRVDQSAAAYDPEDIIWIDAGKSVKIQRGGVTGTTRKVVFGADAPGHSQGDGNADVLFGGRSTDYLVGGGGDDILEGGLGMDIYEYDAARPGFLGLFTTPDGHDTLLDVDGKALVRYMYRDANSLQQTAVLGGIATKSQPDDGTWKSIDGRFVLAKEGNDLKVTFGPGINGSITIKDFKDGDYNIRLREARANPVASYTYDANYQEKRYAATVAPIGDGSAPDVDITWASYGINNVNFGADGYASTVEVAYSVYAGGAPMGVNPVRLTQPNSRFRRPDGLNPQYVGTEPGGPTGIYYVYTYEGVVRPNDAELLREPDDDNNPETPAPVKVFNATVAAMGTDAPKITDPTWVGWQVTGLQLNPKGYATSININYAKLDAAGNTERDFSLGGPAQLGAKPQNTTGNDRILLGAGGDAVYPIGGLEFPESGAGDDWYSGEAGRDILIGGAGKDLLEGGADGEFSNYFRPNVNSNIVGITEAQFNDNIAGGDLLVGGIGDDELYANAKINIADAITQGAAGTSTAIRGDFLTGGAGNDWVVGGSANDYLDGGGGDDIIAGGRGDDDIVADAGNQPTVYQTIGSSDPDAFFWKHERQIHGTGSSTVYTLVETLGRTGRSDTSEAGADVIYAGAGDDWIFSGAKDDYIDAGTDNDVVFGGEGSDVVLGAAGNDVLGGDLQGTGQETGDDYLDGGDGNDHLSGHGGADVLIGGKGEDYLNGGAGKDMYHFNRGDGADTIADPDDLDGTLDAQGQNTNKDKSVLIFGEGFDRTQLKFRKGSLLIDAGNGDQIHLTLPTGPNDPAAARTFDSLNFADGSRLTFEDVLAQGFDIDGTEGNDNGQPGEPEALVGTSTLDRIRGFGGNDLLSGLAGDDSIEGGDGIDTLTGGDGNDLLNAGMDADALQGDTGNDTLDGGEGADTLAGGEGDDTYVINADTSQNAVFDGAGANRIRFGAGISAQTLTLSQATDTSDNTEFLIAEYGNGGSVVVKNGFFSGAMQAYEFADNSVLTHAQLLEYAPSLTLSGATSADLIIGGGQGDTLTGGEGDDTLDAGGGADSVTGEAGLDSLLGGAGNDTLDGGVGNDVMAGGTDSDTYRFARDSGADRINEADTTPGLSDIDNIEFAAGIAPADVIVNRNLDDLVLTLRDTTDTLRVVDYFARDDNYHRIEQFKFTNGTTWTDGTIQSKVSGGTELDDTILGTSANNNIDGLAGNDTIYGLGGSDNLWGGEGNDSLTGGINADVLLGGVGDDTYVYARADGVDTLIEEVDTPTNIDRIEFAADIVPGDVSLVRQQTIINGNPAWTDLLLRVDGQDAIRLPNYLLRADNGLKVEEIAFANGTVWDAAFVFAAVSNPLTEGADVVNSYEFNETIDGLGGNDSINAFSGDDQVLGRAGKDTLNGNLGNDILDGGSEDDMLSGNQGADSLIGGAGSDELNGDTYEGPFGSTLPGGNDTLHGGAGNDLLRGGVGDDTYRFGRGDGTDVIAEFENFVPNSQDKVLLSAGIVPANVTLQRDGNDLLLALDASGTQIRISKFYLTTADAKIERIEFADGTIWDSAAIDSRVVSGAANAMTGTASNDTFVVDNAGDTITEAANASIDTVQSSVSFALGANLENLTLTGYFGVNATGNTLSNTLLGNIGNNVLDGRGGGDVMQGGAGDDTYGVTYGYNDTVIEALDAGIDTVLTDFSYVLPGNVENVRISGSSHPAGSAFLTGNSLDNILDGGGGYVSRGNTVMDGGPGADIMIGRTNAADVFYVDNSGDVVLESFVLIDDGGGDLVNSAITYTLSAAMENLTLTGAQAITGYGNTKNNTIRGDLNTAANVLAGGAGDDTYIIDANDVIVENANEGAADAVELAFGDAVTLDMATAFANVEGAKLQNGVGASHVVGNGAANLIQGNTSANSLSGGGGNDTLYGGLGDDVMDGGSGDDSFFENSIGGVSPQSSGSDTYLFARGSGQDVIQDSDAYGATDVIQFGADIQASDIVLSRVASELNGFDNLLIQWAGATDQITVKYQFDSQNGVEQLRFADGTIWGDAAVDARLASGNANAMTEGDDVYVGSAGADTLNMLGGNDLASGGLNGDVIDGGLGLDTLFGNDGNDTLAGQDNDDYLYGNTGADLLNGGAGADQIFGGAEGDTLSGGTEGDFLYGETGDDSLSGEAGSDRLEGGSGNDSLAGGLDNDQLWGNDGNDTLAGDAGDDTLNGGDGDDNLAGGAGIDQINGNDGSDTYVFARGDGQDTVFESVSGLVDSFTDSIEMAPGILTSDVTVSRLAEDLMITINGSSDRLFIANYFAASIYEIEQVRFAGGTIWDSATIRELALTLQGTSAAETLNGTAGNDRMLGLGGNDTLNGLGGNDLLDGGAGNDSMRGGTGDDTFVADSTSDIVVENSNEGTDHIQSSVTYTLGANVEYLTLTGTAAVNGTGNTLSNVITGNSANNALSGGTGVDTLIGGLGNDTYTVDATAEVVTENVNEGTDLVQASVTYALSVDVENLTLTGTTAINGTGNAQDNLLTGNSAINTLNGGDGNDTLNGGTGADIMLGGFGNDTYVLDVATDTVTEAVGQGTDAVQIGVTYTLTANVENLTLTGTTTINGTGNTLDNVLTGNSAVNTLNGGDGNDTLNGGTGTDIMVGGLGNDTYVLDVATETVTEAAGAGSDTVQIGLTYTLGANVENLVLTGTTAINGTGNTLNNVITGNSANNVLDGGAGVDTLIGGLGNDTYTVDNAAEIVIENTNEGTDLVQSSVTHTLSANIENLTLTGTTAINGTGNAQDNLLTGNSAINTLNGGDGNDTINGGTGADIMAGGLGNDTYMVDVATDTVTEAANEGADLVQAGVTYTLTANIENLTLTGTAAINGTGNALDNLLTGNTAANTLNGGDGNDTLAGGAGTDIMVGGLGNDTYVLDVATETVTEAAGAGIDTVQIGLTYTLAANVENLTLTGTTAINGTGNALDNVLTGNSANNTLDGGAGADAMTGGLGNDTYTVDNAADAVTENLNEGTDLVQSSLTYALGANVENLTLTSASAINGTGNALDNSLTGNTAVNTLNGGEGNDTLNGGAGADIMAGGLGNDTYVVDNAADGVTENLNEGADLVQAGVTYTLGANVENLTLTGTSAINGTGNTLDNVLTGNSAVNTLNGGDGNDTISGGTGVDVMVGGLGNDTYVLDVATETVTEAAGQGADTVQIGVTYTLGANVENLTLTGTTAINGTGNTLDNVITGNSAANTLSGGQGNDAYYVGTGDTVTESTSQGTDTVFAALTWTLGANTENLTLTGTSAINGTGNTLNNVITGNSANNSLSGSTGADTLIGGLGNDTYTVDNAADVVTENLNEGTDLVQASAAYTLSANVENLTLTGTTAINGTGNAQDNLLTGNSAINTLNGGDGNDTINGGTGADIMVGGLGNDTYVLDVATDTVTEAVGQGTDSVQIGVTYTLSANVENLTLTGTTAINGTGNALDNLLTGNTAINTLNGGDGNDTINGGTGTDIMVGGLGDDTYVLDVATETVTEAAGAGSDTVQIGLTYTLGANVENLVLTGTTAINGTGNTLNNALTGNSANNTLTGSDGNDTLDGGAGSDSLVGGLGNDTYIVDIATDTVTEAANQGTDTVQTGITNTLGANVENLTLTGATAINGTGNTLNNTLTGNSANNALDGSTGLDTLNGMGGNDSLTGGLGDDTYGFDLNFGNDVISENDATEGNLDRIAFGAGIASTDIVLSRLNDDLVLKSANQLDSIKVLNWFASGANKVERVDFAGGTSWDAATMEVMAMQIVDVPGLQRDGNQAGTLPGQAGNTVLEGAGGGDTLTDTSGNNLLAGGLGNDTVTAGGGNDLVIGGDGSDTIDTGAGSNIVAVNRGDGADIVNVATGAQNSLSVGGGVGYDDLSLSKSGDDLVVHTGATDSVTLKDWYAAVGNQTMLRIQMILDASADFDLNSPDPLRNQRVQNFDFLGLVNQFDQARNANPGLTQWQMSNALALFHLSGSSDSAIGGDLAYYYGLNNSLTSVGLNSAQQVIGAPGFGQDAQSLRPFSGLQEGLVRLS